MKKAFHISKANIVRHKGAFISLFVIIMIVSALITTGLSLFLGVSGDYVAGTDRLGSLHSVFIMAPDIYNPSFENIISDDPRVSQYDISDAISLSNVKLSYGGDVEVFMLVILDLDKQREVSAPLITEQDLSIAREKAIYLPVYSKGHGQQIGDVYPITYRNKQYDFIVAGFFETNDFSVINNLGLRFFVPGKSFTELKAKLGSSVWITVRFWDIWDSEQFNNDFTVKTGLDLSSFITMSDVNEWSTAPIMPISVFSAIVVVFALLIALISLLVIRFRVTNTIENSMHEIGVLKASGYTSQQIVNSYLLEYGMVSLPAALFGIILPIPVFPTIRQVLASMTGFSWTLGANMSVGIISSLFVVAVLLLMVMLSCRKIKKLPPVTALRGGIAVNSFRRNFFPLHKGLGNAQIRLGFKNIFAFFRFYAMIGLVVAGISLAVTFMAVLYRNFVTDLEGLKRMSGFEISDISLVVTRHTDADALSIEVAQLPEVRKASMLDDVLFEVDGIRTMGFVSDDYTQMEIMHTHQGRFPKYDNEIAIPKVFAIQLGKEIGDSVKVKAEGVSQEFIITGVFSTTNNGGKMGAVTLEGYRRLDPNYKRNSIFIYLHEGIAVVDFIEKLKQDFGVLNIYKQDEDSRFSTAKARAEEKISAYLEQYDIDSVEYSVIYNGEIIISGSSTEYQIEKITDMKELGDAQLSIYSGTMSLVTQVITVVSLVIVLLILSMTVKSIVAKRHRELGTLKASGYTTKQLARQLAISFMPMTAIGVIIGCIVGCALVNPAMSAALYSSGVYSADFVVNRSVIILIGVLVLSVTYGMANFSAMRIRHISVYELLTE